MNDWIEVLFGTTGIEHLKTNYDLPIASHSSFPWWRGYYFDSKLNAYWRLKDWQCLKWIAQRSQTTIRSLFIFRHLMLTCIQRFFSKPKFFLNDDDPFVIYPSRNGIILLDFKKRIVEKIITPLASEPNILENERLAFVHFSPRVPKLITSKIINQQDYYLKFEYIPNAEPLLRSEWREFLPTVIDYLFQYYRDCGITKVPVTQYLTKLEKHYLQEITTAKRLKKIMVDIQRHFITEIDFMKKNHLLPKYAYQAQMHGDLTANNMLKTSNQWYLFDWANGGRFNLCYDLMIQEYYRFTSPFWQTFWRLEEKDWYKNAYFYHSLPYFKEKITQELNISINVSLFQFSLLASLFELALKNFHDYQFHEDKTGVIMLKNVIHILNAIHHSQT